MRGIWIHTGSLSSVGICLLGSHPITRIEAHQALLLDPWREGRYTSLV
jgi:hypothetical protein